MSTYLIADIEVHDKQAYATYVAQVPAFIAKHGGEYAVRGGAAEVREGNWRPHRLVVLRFPTRAAAEAFVNDPDYAPVAAIRHRAATTNMVLVDGYTADG